MLKGEIGLKGKTSVIQTEGVGSIPTSRTMFTDTSKLSIKIIEKQIAFDMIIKNHYSHKKTSTKFALGIFHNKKLIGCMTYGFPVGRLVVKSIVPSFENNEVLELTRLWIADDYGQNIESWFIGQSFRFIKNNYPQVKCLISYADPNVGHQGSIYQATNWLYQKSPMICKAFQVVVDGKILHPRTCVARYGTTNIKKLEAITNKKCSWKLEQKKRRYLYFVCNRKEKRNYLKELKHPILPYPKKEEIK